MLILSAWNYHIPLLFILYAYLFTLYGVVKQICFASFAARTAFMACFAAAGESKIPKTVGPLPLIIDPMAPLSINVLLISLITG